MQILVIGLGNPILGDDGVGWRVVEEIARKTANKPDIEVDCVSLGGLSLMERITGFEVSSWWILFSPERNLSGPSACSC